MWKKVVAPTAVVSLFWVLVSCGTSHILDQLDETQTALLNNNRYVIQAAGAMQESLWRLQAVMLEAAEQIEVGRGSHHDFQKEAKEVEDAFERARDRAELNASTIHEHALIRAIEERFDEYRSLSRDQLSREGALPEEAVQSIEASIRLARAVSGPCEELFELGQRLTGEAFQRRDRLRAKVEVARIAFLIIGPAVGILLGLWVARGLHHSISEISVTLRDASGDLEQEIGLVEVYPSAELGGLPALQQQVQEVSGRIKHVVDELQRTRREAVRAERLAAVGELAAGVAHELRNPLTSVKLLIQAIERNHPAGSKDEKRLQVVEQEICRMETTIQELLDFARPPRLHRIRHDVRDTLRRALNLVSGRAEQGQILIDEDLGGQPTWIDADPGQVDQVFINLLLNAIEAMSPGGQLDVSVETAASSVEDSPTSPSAAICRIVFRDTGSGIPAEVMPRLFEPFVTSKERGIGLGLPISRRIVQEHGGRLTACNPPPGGAMFVVELPLPPPSEGDGELASVGEASQVYPRPSEKTGAQAASH